MSEPAPSLEIAGVHFEPHCGDAVSRLTVPQKLFDSLVELEATAKPGRRPFHNLAPAIKKLRRQLTQLTGVET
jgi:hypothetical protein